jgi:HK97 family phage prohead protease
MPRALLIDQERFRRHANSGHAHGFGVLRFSTDTSVEAQQEQRTLRFVFSDGSIDRYGDRIDPAGWELDEYKTNNVALWAHDSSLPPIGRGLNVGHVSGRLMGDIEFAGADINPFADMIYRMYKDGFLSAVSVGFLPLEWNFVNEPERRGGIDFKRQSLMEISCVPVPALPTALIEARAAGIDTAPMIGWAEKMLDQGGMLLVPRAELEALRKAAGTATSMPFQAIEPEIETAAPTPPENNPGFALDEDVKSLMRQVEKTLRAVGAILVSMTTEPSTRIKPPAETRAGRVLSGENETALRDAHDLMTQASDKVRTVISKVEAQDDPPEYESDEIKARRLRRARAFTFLKLVASAS